MFGLFKIEPPATNNQVKITMYGSDNFAHTSTSESEPCYASPCNMGTKAIAVIGGQLDIQGLADPTCPAWEKLRDLGEGGPKRPSLDCGEGVTCPHMEIMGSCAESHGHTDALGKLTMSCPVKFPEPVRHGDRKALVFKALERPTWSPPKDPTSGEELSLRVKTRCGNSAGHTNRVGRCVLYCGIEKTATIPHGEASRFVYTSVPDVMEFPCDSSGENCMSLTIKGAFQHSRGHSNNLGKYIAFVNIETTVDIPYGANVPLKFTSKQTGESIAATGGVHHWAWRGQYFFFSPDEDVSVLNSKFPPGTEFSVEYLNAPPGGQTFNVEGIYHWAWGGSTHYFYPEGYTAAECNQAAADFNAMFPVGYDIEVSLPADLQEASTGSEVSVNGVHHWAWPTGTTGQQRIYLHPDVSVAEFNVIFTTGTKIDAIYATELEYNDIVVSPKAAECWTPGTELLLTSHTRWSADRQIVTVTATDTATGTLTLDAPIAKPITLADSPDFAIEVASLNRSVVLDAERDANMLGGHLMVHNTDLPQTISGVAIYNFGQQGVLGRYPLHFHFCGDSPGSLVKNNVVYVFVLFRGYPVLLFHRFSHDFFLSHRRDSTQRGYVIHATNNVTLEDNVALDVEGHCYFLEKNTEVGNVFRHNLGAGVLNMPSEAVGSLSGQSGRTETDNNAAIFWISNPQNFFYHNVAAGSQKHGYWFETRPSRRHLDIGAFEGNEVHSSQHFGWTTYPPGWVPDNEAIIKDLKVYRNAHWGMFLHVTKNLRFVGGIVADNGVYGCFINRGDAQIFEGTVFNRHTGFAEKYLHACSHGQNGLALHPARLLEFDRTGTVWGSKLVGAEFYNFEQDVTDCSGGSGKFYALQLRTEQVFVPAYSAPHYFYDVKFGNDYTLDACILATHLGVDDVQMEVVSDSHRAFTPTGETGFLVSKKATAMLPAGTVCTLYDECLTNPNGSLDFCTGVCLRTISVETDASTTDGIVMVVSYDSNPAHNIIIEGKLRSGETARFHRTYTVVLPAGQFTVAFYKDSQHTWPQFVRPVLEVPPESCTDYVVPSDLTVLAPESTRSECAVGTSLTLNGQFDTSIEGWLHFGSTIVFSPNEGVGGSGALKTTNRKNMHVDSVYQYLDTSCVVAGNTYEISISYRNVDKSGVTMPACLGNSNDCPSAFGTYQTYNLETGGRTIGYFGMANTNLPYQMNGFNTMTGTWTASSVHAAADSIYIRIVGGTGQFILDDISITRTA